jgi:hypothetical protein
MDIDALLREKGGIQLDIGCGQNKQSPAWIGMDVRPFPGVDIIHDWNDTPWPLPDECVTQAIASHVVEHVPPVYYKDGKTVFGFIAFMDEVWRVLKPDARFAIALPYGLSGGMLQDPTHVNFCNEHTWLYFDPIAQGGQLYRFYRPKPWKITDLFWDVSGNMEVLLIKRREDRSYYE